MKKIALLLTLALTLGSCESWFDINPRSQTKQEKLFSTEAGFRSALYGIYLDLGEPQLYGLNLTMGFTDALSQYYTLSSAQNEFHAIAQGYDYGDAKLKARIGQVWAAGYNAIVNINNLLEQMDKKGEGFFSNSRTYGILRGEAIALRALVHFDMLRLIGPSPATHAESKALPFVDRVSKTPFAQLTTAQMIARCLDELEEAAGWLYESDPISPYFDEYEDSNIITGEGASRNDYIHDSGFMLHRKGRLNYLAVHALMARIALYGGDPSSAAGYVEDCFGIGRFEIGDNLFALHVENISGMGLWGLYFGTVATTSNGLLMSSANRAFFYETTRYPADTRINGYFTGTGGYFNMSKYRRSETDNDTTKPQFMPVLSASELYLIYAECAASQSDRYDAINAQRAQFNLIGSDILTPENAPDLKSEIYKEYRKRFIGEGQMFFYMKRNNMSGIDRDEETVAIPARAYTMMDYLPEEEYNYGDIEQ